MSLDEATKEFDKPINQLISPILNKMRKKDFRKNCRIKKIDFETLPKQG